MQYYCMDQNVPPSILANNVLIYSTLPSILFAYRLKNVLNACFFLWCTKEAHNIERAE